MKKEWFSKMPVVGITHGTLAIEVGLVFNFAVVFMSITSILITDTTQDPPIFSLHTIFNAFSFCPSNSTYIILYIDIDLDSYPVFFVITEVYTVLSEV
jgi:hypothetical protein